MEIKPPRNVRREIEKRIQTIKGSISFVPHAPGAFVMMDHVPRFFALVNKLRELGIDDEVIGEIAAGRPGAIPTVVIHKGWTTLSWWAVTSLTRGGVA